MNPCNTRTKFNNGLGGIAIAALLLACSSSSSGAAAAAACNPAGTFTLQKPTVMGTPAGTLCTMTIPSDDTETVTVAKQANGTFTVTDQGETADPDDAYTLDTANCTLTRTLQPQPMDVPSGASIAVTTVNDTIVLTFTNNDANVSRVETQSYTASTPPTTSVPCTITSTRTGTKA